MTMALLGFLDHWLQVHITGCDQKLGAFLREHRVTGRSRGARRAG